MARFEKLSRKSVLQLTSISVSIRRGSSCPPLVKARRSGIAAAITEDSLPNVDMKLRHPGSIIEKIRKLQFKTCGNLSADVKFVTCPAQLSPRWVFPAGVMQTGMRVLLAVAALALVATPGPVTVQAASSFTDVDVLNFALNLECLEAEFYSWVAYGKGIASFDGLVGNSSSALKVSSSGGVQRSSSFSTEAIAIATEIAENEIKHVSYLRSALKDAGATAVNCPNVDVSPAAFTAAAKAAAPTLTTSTSAPVFSPYSSDTAFYIGAFIFEDVGVTAYKGAVQVLQSQAYATVAAGIGAVEAGHAAIVRQQLYQRRSAATGLTAGSTAITVQAAVQAIADLRDAAGGTASASVENYLVRTPATFTGVTTSLVGTTGPDLFAANKTTAVAFTRIPRQVLDIVYLGTYATPGGFFPSGISGNTHVVNATGTPTTTACSGAFSMASLSAVVPLVLTGVAVLFGVMW